ncbi:MAG: aspartate-semialdehyde dehydrogenase, partial [Phycisphaerales bacterium]|nr:aspartate-semialdehyde dehydrogenase [Phycisphaerales bacterium]
AVEAGAVVVDNSAAFRMSHPLVIPTVNGHLVQGPGLYANPNCSTIMFVAALDPIRRAFGLRHVTVSTYQAVSGAGRDAIEELRTQTRALARGEVASPQVFPEPCAQNVFPHESEIDDTGFNGEERKMIAESARLWNEDVPILPTCVRVPVERAHSQSIVAELDRPASAEAIIDVLRATPGLRLVDTPTPLKAAHTDDVHVGRVRTRGSRVAIWTCCDQLRRGAALNTIEIADLAIRGAVVPSA